MLQHPYKDNGQYPYMGVHHYLYMGKEVKVVLVNNATYIRIAKTVLLPSTTYKAYLSSTDYKKKSTAQKEIGYFQYNARIRDSNLLRLQIHKYH